MNLASILRHWFTAAASAVTVALAAWLTLSADDVHKLTDAFGMLVEPLIVIVGILAVAVWRIVLAKGGELFRRGSGETDDKDSAGGLSPCVVGLCMAAAFVGLSLPSCSTYPVTADLKYRDPKTGASVGFSTSPDKPVHGSITVPIYDAQTGELLGMTDVKLGNPVLGTK